MIMPLTVIALLLFALDFFGSLPSVTILSSHLFSSLPFSYPTQLPVIILVELPSTEVRA